QTSVALESFDGGDVAALHLRRARLARLDRLPVDENGAGAALALAAAVLRAGEVERLAENGQQRVDGRDLDVASRAVDPQSDAHRAIVCPSARRDCPTSHLSGVP